MKGRPTRDTRRSQEVREGPERRSNLIGRWVWRRSVRRLGRRAAGGDTAAVEALVRALAARHADAEMQGHVLAALGEAARAGVDEARETLCNLAIDRGIEEAARLAVGGGYTPRDDARKALFFLLTGQTERLEGLDPDHRLLRRAYWSAGPEGEPVRRRVMERLQEHGRLDAMRAVLVNAVDLAGVVGSGEARRLAEMTDQEWDLAVQVLSAQSRWAEMIRLVEVAPARWSAVLLETLETWWREAPVDEDLRHLVRLAQEWRAAGGPVEGVVAVGRRGWTARHDNWVWRVGFSPDGTRLASGGADAALCLWRASDGDLIWRGRYGNSVSGLVFSPDGEHVVAGGWDHTVRMWRVADGSSRWVGQHEGAVTSLDFSRDGRYCLSGGWDHTVRLWRASDGERFFTRSHDDVVWTVGFSPDGRFWASGGWDGTIRLWQVGDGRSVWRRAHARSVSGLAFSPDGRRLASIGADGVVHLWNVEDGEEVWRQEQAGGVFSVAFSPAGVDLATSGAGGVVRVSKVARGRPVWESRHDHEVWSVAYSRDGTLLATAGMDRTIRVFRAADGRCVWRRRGEFPLFCAAFSPASNDLVSVGWDHVIRMWRLVPWWAVPLADIDSEDMNWLRGCQADAGLDGGQRAGLRLLAALMERRQRWEIEVADVIDHVPIGEFDIEIEETRS